MFVGWEEILEAANSGSLSRKLKSKLRESKEFDCSRGSEAIGKDET
jgi:hypothetical protein